MKRTHPVCKVMCASCPFREGSKYGFLKADLTKSALTQSSRICHSTGSNGINHRTGKAPRLCRGARNVQLTHFHRIGFIEAATDQAWAKKWAEMSSTPR